MHYIIHQSCRVAINYEVVSKKLRKYEGKCKTCVRLFNYIIRFTYSSNQDTSEKKLSNTHQSGEGNLESPQFVWILVHNAADYRLKCTKLEIIESTV